MLPWVESWCDVEGDGNCGFRACALQLLGSESEWKTVRAAMYRELVSHQSLYEEVFLDPIEENIQRLIHWEGSCPSDKWWIQPDLGFVFATVYNVVFVCLSRSGSVTCLPHRAPPDGRQPDRIISTLSTANLSHYVSITLMEGSMLPPINSKWYSKADPSVVG